VVRGTQTAIVVGPAGEEIYPDKYGRVKVQFHWDREGKRDENSSCWIRVAQVWAGAGWGGMYIPRIGHEVIVDFLEGDPDRPIIIGCVYHGANMPPYPLPDEKTKSVIKSDSSLGGGGSNEIRFEDKKGKEEIYLHGQKDLTIAIENDKNQTIGHDESLLVKNNRKKTVGVNQSESIGSNKTIKVGSNHTESIGANMVLNVGANKTESIGGNETRTVGSTKTETVAINTAETIGAAKELTIGGLYQVSVGAAMNETVGAAKAEEIGAFKAVVVGGNSTEKIGGSMSVDVGKDLSEKVAKTHSLKAKKVMIEAEDEIGLKTGDATLILKKDGSIMIKGKDMAVKASGKINAKADKDIVLKGQKIQEN
jgi:type VI secretion system secreted protein VgrG